MNALMKQNVRAAGPGAPLMRVLCSVSASASGHREKADKCVI